MLESDEYIDRGDTPAKIVLRANAEQKAVRKAIETQEELHKIRERVTVTLSAYEVGEQLRAKSQNNVEDIKNAFVKEDAALEFVDDMAALYLILSDPIAKRKYQQKVTIFVVGYENLCNHRHRLLSQLQEFFNDTAEDKDFFSLSVPEFDLEEVEKNVSEALNKAEKTTERLANISKDVLKVFEMVNPKDQKRGKKKLEKALYQSQQDVMNLTEKLVGAQSDLEDAKNKLNTLNKQLELKESDVERLKSEVNGNKAFEKQCNDLKKALQAKEHQLQAYRAQMDEVELSLSQAESKYDQYVEICGNLREENQKLKDDVEARSMEQQRKIIEIRKELETKYDNQVTELKEGQEKALAELKESHEDELISLREKLDMRGRQSLTTADSSVPAVSPDSRDSARFSGVESEYTSRTLRTWKSSAKTVQTIVEVQKSVGSRLSTAPSKVSENGGKDSMFEKSSSIFVSMSNASVPASPRTADSLRASDIRVKCRDTSPLRHRNEQSTQTYEATDTSGLRIDELDANSKQDLLQIEREMARTPTNELPQKMDEYKNKFFEVEKQLQEEILQWKMRYNTKVQTLNEVISAQEKDLQEKGELMKQISVLQEQKDQAEREAEEAILQLEEARVQQESNLGIGLAEVEEGWNRPDVQTKNKATTTSASLNGQDSRYEIVGSSAEHLNSVEDPLSVALQCPSAAASREVNMVSPQYSDGADVHDDVGGLEASDSGFGGSQNILPSKDSSHVDLNTKESFILEAKEFETRQVEAPNDRCSLQSPASGRVRSRLVRSALRDHRVVVETVRTYEMITKFKMDMVVWLQQHGLGEKCKLLNVIPDIALNKDDELNVLSQMSAIRDITQQILEALSQITKDDYSWPHDDLLDSKGDHRDVKDNVVHRKDIGIEVDMKADRQDLSCLVAGQQEQADDKPLEPNLGIKVETLPAWSAQTARRHVARSTPTTPKGYTLLLHEYNNLSEEYNMLTQQLQDNVKSYQEQITKNATVMNEMQETINNLRLQLMERPTYARISAQPSVSSMMFTRLDAERNVKSMKRAVLTRRLTQDSYNAAIDQMNEYVNLPAKRLAELVKRYRHHCFMRDVEEGLNPVHMTSADVYNLQEKMEHLQRLRALKWSEKMVELSKERALLGDKITSCLSDIEESSGIFLIKPVYSYISRPPEMSKTLHPVICKKRFEIPHKSAVEPSPNPKKSTYSLEAAQTPDYPMKQSIHRQTWNSQESHVSENVSTFDNNLIPRLLAMDVNRITLNKNPVSESIEVKTASGGLKLSGVRQYVTVERPIGGLKSPPVDQSTGVAVSPRRSLPVDSRASSPSLSHYNPLPPISFPNQPHSSISSVSLTNQSMSSLSVTSFDENCAR